MHVAHTVAARYRFSRLKKKGRSARWRASERASEKVQNIALRGSNLPDRRKGAARTRKMRNSTRNGRMFWNHGARRTSSDNVATLVLVYIRARARTYIRMHLVPGYTCIRTCGDTRTDTLAGTNVSALRAGGRESINRAGRTKSREPSTARVLFASLLFRSYRPLEKP